MTPRAELWKGITQSGVAEADFHKTLPSEQNCGSGTLQSHSTRASHNHSLLSGDAEVELRHSGIAELWKGFHLQQNGGSGNL